VSALLAFPADGYTARWQRWDLDGDETVQLRWENEGWTAIGEVGHERVTYVLRISPLWQVRQFLLFRDVDDPDLWLGTDGTGTWGEVNGSQRSELAGCVDVALTCTPFTHAVPIRRHGLGPGESIEVRTAFVDVETLGVTPVTYRYERIGDHRWSVAEVRSDVAGGGAGVALAQVFDVDDYGLPHDVDDAFRRR
jgi:hypothetical protein